MYPEELPHPHHKAKATIKCRAPVYCLVTVPVSCLDTAAARLSFPLKPQSIFFGRWVLGPWMYAVFHAWKSSYSLVCCAVTEKQCLTAAVSVTAPCVVLGYSGVSRSSTQQPVSCFDTITLCRAWTQQGCHVLDTTAVYRVLRCSRERRGVVGLAGLTSRLPGHNVVRYVPGGVAPSAPQSKSDHEV